MTTLELNTALENFHPSSPIREEAAVALDRFLRAASFRQRFSSFRGLAHDDIVQEVMHTLWKRRAPVVANCARAYLYVVVSRAYKNRAMASARARQHEVLHTTDLRELQERRENHQEPTFTSREHARAELVDAMPTLADHMFDVNIDAIMLGHFVREIVPLLSNRTQDEGRSFASDRVAIVTGQQSVPGLLVANLAGSPATPANLQRARHAFNKRASRYRGYFADIFAREDLARVTGLLEDEVRFLEQWARAMAII